jgi:hypothetical protein
MKKLVLRFHQMCDLLGAALLTTAIGGIAVTVILAVYLLLVHLPVVIPALGACFLLGLFARFVLDL